MTFRHAIDTASTWQPAMAAVGGVAVPTTLEIAVDSPTDNALDGIYTALNPTQVIIAADQTIFDRGGVPGASEPIQVMIGGEDYFFFSNFVGSLSGIPASGANPASSDFDSIQPTDFQQHHVSQDILPGSSTVFNVAPGGETVAVHCIDNGDGGNGGEEFPTCNGVLGTLVGTDNDDILLGTPGDDVIIGRRGNDRIDGREGNDLICSGAGNDNVFGGAGADDLRGGAGDDILKGNEDNDVLHGGLGNDDLRGNAGNDTLRGDAGNDTLSGGEDDDDLRGGTGRDDCKGGPGIDKAQGCENVFSVP